jgi:hypothetical protein
MLLTLAATTQILMAQQSGGAIVKYVRYSSQGATSFGILEGDNIRELRGDLFANPQPTGRAVRLADVKLLPPCLPSKVIAVGLNYKSHLGTQAVAAYPGLFAKYPTSIIATGENIVIPFDAKNVHYEGRSLRRKLTQRIIMHGQPRVFGQLILWIDNRHGDLPRASRAHPSSPKVCKTRGIR